jgi:hypothetical protein
MSYLHSKMFHSHLLLGIRIIVIIHRDCRLSQPQSGLQIVLQNVLV